jgi:integrase
MTKQPDNIKKMPSGKYRARYFAGYDSNGARVYPQATFATLGEAREWLDEERPNRSGTASGHRWTVGAWLDHWLKTHSGIRKTTRRQYHSTIETNIKPYLGKFKLQSLNGVHIRTWQATLLEQGLSKSRVNSARSRLSSAYSVAIELKMCKYNPVTLTDGAGTGKQKEVRHLKQSEVQRFLDACASAPYGLLFEFMLRTGVRIMEAAAVRWADLQLDGNRGVVHIRHTIVETPGGGWEWSDPKTEDSKRRPKFPRHLAVRLIEHRRAQLEQKLKMGSLWRNNDLVFTNDVGDPVRYNKLWQGFRSVLTLAGLPHTITSHKLRHLYVTAGKKAGVDWKTIAAEVGHSKPSFTMDYYGEPDEDQFDEACDKRDALLTKGSY